MSKEFIEEMQNAFGVEAVESIQEEAAEEEQEHVEAVEEAVEEAAAEGSEEEVVEATAEVSEESEEDVAEYTDDELLAISKGWRPEGVPGKKNKTAEEFLQYEQEFDLKKQLEAKIAQQDELMAKVVEHIKQAEQVAYDRALQDMRAEMEYRVQSNPEQASQIVNDFMEKQANMKPQLPEELENIQAPVQMHESEREFINRYDAMLSDESDPVNTEILAFVQGMNSGLQHLEPAERIARVEQKMLRAFPEKFKPKMAPKKPKVEAKTTAKAPKSDGVSRNDLSRAERGMLQFFEDAGVDGNDLLKNLQKGE